MIIDIILITLICVFVIDCTDFVDNVKKGLSKRLTNGKIITSNYDFKPFSCSLCMTWWTGLFYLIFTHCLTLPAIAFVLFMAANTTNIRTLILFFDGLFNKIITDIANYFQL